MFIIDLIIYQEDYFYKIYIEFNSKLIFNKTKNACLKPKMNDQN